tara:strand:- start:107 stop:358 length:252 start_codon:yes stop_codon:yes gene_type:complete
MSEEKYTPHEADKSADKRHALQREIIEGYIRDLQGKKISTKSCVDKLMYTMQVLEYRALMGLLKVDGDWLKSKEDELKIEKPE